MRLRWKMIERERKRDRNGRGEGEKVVREGGERKRREKGIER